MGTLGRRILEEDPETYAGRTPEDLERVVSERLASPEKRPSVLRELRRVFKKNDWDDDRLANAAMRQINEQPQPVVATGATATSSPNPETAKKLQDYGAYRTVMKGWKPIVFGNAREQQSNMASEADKEAYTEAKESVISPQELANPRVPSVDWATMKRMRDQDPNLHITDVSDQNTFVGRNFGWMNPRVQLQDKKTGIAKAQLDPTATYPADEVAGIPKYLPTWDTITGTSDPMQRLTAMGAAAVYNPFAKEGERFLGKPADVAKSTIPEGIGLPEYGKQAGKNLEGNPLVAPFAGTANVLATGAGAVPSSLSYVFNKAGAALTGSDILGEMADENAQELARARADLEQQIVKPDVARAGENLGMVAQAFNPLSIANLAGGPFVKAGRAVLGAGVKRGAQALEHAYPAGSNKIADIVRGAATMATETPSALVAPGESGTSIRSGVAAMRSEPAIYERKLYEEMIGKVKAATGASDEEARMLDRLAAENWNTPEARMAAVQQDPRVAAVFELGQPYHEAPLRSAYGDNLAYDPFHLQYGQNIAKSNKFMEREIGHRAANDQIIKKLEQQKAVGDIVAPQSLQGIPGFDQSMMQRVQAGDVVPRRGRSIEDTYNLLKETRLSPGRLQEVEKLGAMGGIAKTARRVEEGKGLGQKALYKSVFDDIQLHREAKPTSWKTVDEYAQQHAINEPIVGEEGLDVKREGTGDFNMTKAWADKLRANDDVLLRVVPDAEYDIKDFQRAPLGVHRITYSIPQSLAPANLKSGMIIDRRVAQGLMEAANPSAAMDSAERVASWIESVMASGQINKATTLGRPGFSLRNRVNELFRVGVHDPNALTDKTVASIADEVSHSSVGPGGRVVTELPPNPVTGKPYTIGELHELALSQTGMGRGSLQEAQGLVSEFPRAMWSDTAAGRALDKAIEAGMAPGVAVNKAQDALFKEAMFPNVNARYGAEDAMRLSVFINELKNGVRPSIAGNTTRNLMIDFGDKNALQMAGKAIFPFIKYQSSAGPQMIKMILDNPNRFVHSYRVAKYLEHEDARSHGGTGINAKYKSVADMLSGAPALTDTATTARVLRPDTTIAEFASQVENLGKIMDSDAKGQSAVEAFAGPAWSDLYASFTGINPSTGRNVFNVDEDTFKSIKNEQKRSSNPLSWFPRSYMANALYERQQREKAAGINESYLGAHPEFGRAYEVVKGLPGVSRVFASDPWNLAARAYNGGSNPASRAQETSQTMMERALTSYITGLRSSTIDYPQVAARSVQQTTKALPKPVEQSIKRKAMQGRIGNP